MTEVLRFLEAIRSCGKLADIDIVFASFVGRNANNSPGLALLAALVSNASSIHGETALPAERIWTKDSLRRCLKKMVVEPFSDEAAESAPPVDAAAVDALVDGLPDWPPDTAACPHPSRQSRPAARFSRSVKGK